MIRLHIWIIIGVTALSLAGLFIVSFQFNPFEVGNFIKLLFLTSLFIFLWGSGAIATSFIGSVWRADKKNSLLAYLDSSWSEFYDSFRRGLLISVFITGTIILKRLQIFSIWTFLVFCIILVFVEFVLLKTRKASDLAESLTD